MVGDDEGRRHHFLIVAFGMQSHVNPARVLARRLARLGADDGSVLATVSLPLYAHRRVFPSPPDGAAADVDEEATDGVVSYVPHSDGVDDGSSLPKDAAERARRRRAGFESLSAVVARLAARGRPVTCIMGTMVHLSVLDVARELGIPLAAFWIQPATVLAAYHHYFHGYGELIASNAADPGFEVTLPGLPRPLRIRDLPSFLVDTTGGDMAQAINDSVHELLQRVARSNAKVLVNTLDGLEPTALAAMKQHADVFAVGPLVGPSSEERVHLFDHAAADHRRYMDWLATQPERSVVYVSFGSISKSTKQQMEEIALGLRRSGRPFLLVVRKDGLLDEGAMAGHRPETVDGRGMVVEWCNQLEVLSHPAMGCFVTHCGWNSTLEAVLSGVPVIGVPNMFDQPTNAYLAAEEWMIGVRAERDGEGVLTATELARCIELVMGEGAAAMAARERAMALRGVAQEVVGEGGLAERNLRDFVRTM